MGGPRLTVEDARRIVLLCDKGLSTRDTSDLLGFGLGTVTYAYRFAKDLREGNVEDMKDALPKSGNSSLPRLVAEALGVNLDEFLADKKQDTAPPPTDPNALVVLERLTDTMQELRDGMRDLAKSLSQIQMVLQGARQENNEKLTKITEAININGDIASKEHEALRVIVDNIKGNVKALARKGGVEQFGQ